MAGASQVLHAESFGALLRLLRRRVHLTQMELGVQVGYSEAHISRLENEQRTPDPVIVATRFVPALMLDDEPEVAARLVQLADRACGGILHDLHFRTTPATQLEQLEEVGALETIPAPPSMEIPRREELNRLAALLESQGAAALIGMPGMGKTTLAAQLAREEQRPVFWFTFSPAVAPALDVLIRQLALFLVLEGQEQAGFLLTTSSPAPAWDQQINIIASALAGVSGLLCFDDIHELKDGNAWEAIRRWMKVEPVRFLFISREELPGLGVPQIRLDGLGLDEAEELIQALSQGMDHSTARQVHTVTAGNPMLIRLALGQMTANGTQAGGYLENLALEPTLSAYILDAMLKDLQPDTSQLIAWLSLLRHPVDLYQPQLVACLQAVLPEPAGAIDESRRRQLIDRPDRAVLHPLVRSHIQHRLAAEPDVRSRLHHLAADCCMKAQIGDAVEVAYHLSRAGEVETAVDWLTDHVRELRNRGLTAGACQVVDEMFGEIPVHDGSRILRRRLLSLRADLLVHSTRAEEAEQAYRQALDLSPLDEVGPVAWSQLALRLANCLMQRTRVQEAAELLQEALMAMGEGSALVRVQLEASMARAQLMTTQLESAEMSAQTALGMIKDVERIAPHAAAEASAAAHSMLGIILRIRRDYHGSIQHWNQAIHEAQRAGQLEMEYRSLVNLAGAYYEQGDLDKALEICEEARTGLTAIGDSYALARVLNTMALLHHVRGELDRALARAVEARDLKALIGDRQGWANSEAQRAIILLNLGQIEEGTRAIEAVIDATSETGEERAQAIYLDTLGLALALAGKGRQAQLTLEKGMQISNGLGDNRLRANLEDHLVQAFLGQGKLAEAEALAFAQVPEGAGPEVEFERELDRAMVLHAKGDRAAAVALAKDAAARARESGFSLLGALAEQLADPGLPALAGAELLRRGWVLQTPFVSKQTT
ncbi:MAG: tetratricopeptide repeat protein [Anaerolineales bacterium]